MDFAMADEHNVVVSLMKVNENNRRVFPVLVAWIVVWAVIPLWGDVMVLTPSRDASIYSESDSLSDSVGPHLFAGRLAESQGETFRRALLSFDFSAIPSGSTIQGVALTMFVDNSPFAPPDPVTFTLHPLLAGWTTGNANAGDPGGQGAPAGTGDPTWGYASYTNIAWGTSGGDFGAASATSLVGQAGATAIFNAPGMAADVQGWLDNPGGNHGWILIGDETLARSARRFSSSENTLFDGPALEVTYVVPEPGTWVLLVSAAVMLGAAGFRRRV